MLRNLACDFIISCLIDFLNLTQMIVCMYMVAVIVLDILELIIKLLDLPQALLVLWKGIPIPGFL